MHWLVRENLEDFLAGSLRSTKQREVEAHLAECESCRQEWESLRLSSVWMRSLRPPEDLAPGPAASFYARVLGRIEQERRVPFWTLLLEPAAFGRRMVFACLMLLALLGAYVAASDRPDYPSRHRPEAVLAGRPAAGTPVPAAPRLGPNLQRNRSVALATLAAVDGD